MPQGWVRSSLIHWSLEMISRYRYLFQRKWANFFLLFFLMALGFPCLRIPSSMCLEVCGLTGGGVCTGPQPNVLV